jgi:hypothetical protein
LKAHLDELPVKRFNPTRNTKYLRALLDYFAKLRDSGISPEHYDSFIQKIKKSSSSDEFEVQEELSAAYSAFVELKKNHGVVFDIGTFLLQ